LDEGLLFLLIVDVRVHQLESTMDGLPPVTQFLNIIRKHCVSKLVMEAILDISKSRFDDCLLEDLIEDVDKDKVKDIGIILNALFINKAVDHHFLECALIDKVHCHFFIEEFGLLLLFMDEV
jgi:hypothetical protein